MNFSDYKSLHFQRRGRVLEVILNRPEKMNAVDAQMHGELARVFTEVGHDLESEVIVLTGAGKTFSAGGDMELLQRGIDEPAFLADMAREGKQLLFALLDCEKPIIAKVNGHATGLGATMVLFCDVIFASEAAKIGDPHVAVGLTAGDGGAVIWPQLIGYARAKEYLMTGDLVPAPEAARMGLINHAVPAGALDERVALFADRLATGASQAIRWTKMAVNIRLKQVAQSVFDASVAYELMSSRTKDHQEAVNAFRERRKPVFIGS